MYHRELFDDLSRHLISDKHSIIVGPRQTGKTTLLKQLRSQCKAAGQPSVFIDLEHRDVLSELDKDPENLFLYCPKTSERIYIFIDEIQRLKDPSNFLKQIYDDHKSAGDVKIIASGSSAFYVDEKFNDSLAGRKRIFSLYTCSFTEYLLLSGKENLLEELIRICQVPEAKTTALALLRGEFLKYMQFGGYPDVVIEKDEEEKKQILMDLRDSFVKKDIDEAGIENQDAFYRLFKLLAIQTGGLTNINEISRILRIKAETVSKYLSVMEKCFHIGLVRPFHKNLEKELVKMPVCYFFDSGMRNMLINNFMPFNQNPDSGKIWENQVFGILVNKYGRDEIRFWRTTDKKEVDFILPNIQEPFAVEVKTGAVYALFKKYRTFTEAYPEMALRFACIEPFDEDVLRFVAAPVSPTYSGQIRQNSL